ncbi:nitrite reductase small subunit NirD [Thermomonospora umbrina]|uniref:Nitrite reductase (NADH) small subunit n=1 Tax=Thermomonospora umbrina TaxID=111806 RepID=A0A3D9SXD9_9ACTN|nr:nitrite reductase small subunit NirD [Thermomonospora umbrina]REF00228.1 nitrite reductase (NADH) small subunit [Thermomonospora umbrina]
MTADVQTGPAHTAPSRTATRWHDVCGLDDLMPERGACALIEGVQVAIFRTFDGELFALSNYDPFSGAYVIARGILGTRGGVPTVASPMFKDVFDLRTGQALDDADVALRSFEVRLTPQDRVEVALS